MVNAPHAAQGPAKAGTNHQGESPRCLKGRGWKTAVEGRSCSWQTKWPWFQRCPSAPRGDGIPQGTGCSGFAPSIPQAAGAQTARRWAWAGRGRDHAPAPLGPAGRASSQGPTRRQPGTFPPGPGAARPLRCFSAPFPRVSAFPSAATSRQERETPSASTVVSADDAPCSEAEHERVLTGNKSTSFKCAGSLKPRLRKVKLLSEWQVALRDAWTAPNRTCCSCQPH